MESNGGGGRRRRSLSEEKIDSSSSNNLRDFLRVKEDGGGGDEDGRRHSLTGLTLSAVLASEKRERERPPTQNRTLLDIIRDDPNGGFKDNKKSWKAFKDKLRLRRAGAAWTSMVHIPASDVPIQNNNGNSSRMISRRNSTRLPPPNDNQNPEASVSSLSTETINLSENRADLNSRSAMMMRRNSSRIPSLASSREGRRDFSIRREGSLNSSELSLERHQRELSPEEEEGEGETAAGEEEEEAEREGGGESEQPVRMSLMALLAETDREMGLDGSAYMMDDDEDEEDEDEEEEENGGVKVGGEYNNCCVCMVRHKGSAFIPCGHTFCRLCSRELWVQRGNCPLCNNFILEILDIF